MNGFGIIRGLLVPVKHFFETYIDDLKWLGKKYYKPEGIALRSSAETKGIFSIHTRRKNFLFRKNSGISHSRSTMKLKMGLRKSGVRLVVFVQRFARLNVSGSSGKKMRRQENRSLLQTPIPLILIFA
jgi:hypothetical protein